MKSEMDIMLSGLSMGSGGGDGEDDNQGNFRDIELIRRVTELRSDVETLKEELVASNSKISSLPIVDLKS
jgi:hypothetical protein